MKKTGLAIFIALASLSLHSCNKVVGTGPVVSETRTVSTFSEIEFGVPGNVEYIQADNYEILIMAQRNIIDVIDTYVSDNKLKVKVRHNSNIRSHEDIKIIVRAPAVQGIALQGSGNLDIPGNFSASHARLSISGSGNMNINNLESDVLDLGISGSGNIYVRNGSALREDINISGSGDIDVSGVEVMDAKTQTSGSGSVRVFVQEHLDARISGSGSVFYKGNASVTVNISGSGSVIKL